MRMAIVGSHEADLRLVAGHVLYLISTLDDRDELAVRPTEGVDYIARVFGESFGHKVFTYSGGQREANYQRDRKLVSESDRVEAFFAPQRVMSGGTGHIVEVALEMGKPVRAWTTDPDGELVLVGGADAD